MNYIYIIISLIIILYITFRKVDFLSIGAACFIIYHSHAAYGEVYIHSRERVNVLLYEDFISDKLYLILFSQLLILLFSIVIYDYLAKKNKTDKIVYVSTIRNDDTKAIHKSFVILGFLSLFTYSIDIFKIGFVNLAGNKSYVWQQTGLFYTVSLWSAMAVFSYAIKNKKFSLLFISVPQILIHLFIGSRAYFAVIIIIMIIYYGHYIKHNLVKNIKLYVLGAIGAIGIMAYKRIWMDVKAFDFIAVMNTLLDKETYLWILRLGEPRIVLADYNYIINSSFRLDFSDLFVRLITIFPFANRLGNPTHDILLSSVIRNDFNASYGLASNFWAEGYAMFGYFGIYLFFIIWIVMLKKGNEFIESNSWISYFAIPIISYLAFYIHRMDYIKVIGNIKMLFFSALVWWFINSFLTNNWIITIRSKYNININKVCVRD